MSDNLFIRDENFVSVQPGEPYRLLPFGVIVRNGKRRAITPEIAAQFRLPHFKPPIKLGSHEDPTPAGGHIVALEVRGDGLYAIPELNERGAAALRDGAYRYHSPEIIWAGGGLEDPTSGAVIPGPLIVGDALLHTPHLGEQAALYEANLLQKGSDPVMSENETSETIVMPQGFWSRSSAWLARVTAGGEVEPEPEEPPAQPEAMASGGTTPEALTALQAERDELAARLAQVEAQQAQAERVAAYTAQIAGLPVQGGGEMLAGMSDEQAAWVVAQLRALGAQIVANDRLTATIGTDAPAPTTPHEAISAYAAENHVSYVQAFEAVRAARPEMFK